jgi:hypothetical protein
LFRVSQLLLSWRRRTFFFPRYREDPSGMGVLFLRGRSARFNGLLEGRKGK